MLLFIPCLKKEDMIEAVFLKDTKIVSQVKQAFSKHEDH